MKKKEKKRTCCAVDGVLWESDSESDSSPSSSFDMDTRADTTTTAVVIFVIIVGIGTIVAVCFAWKRRSQHVSRRCRPGTTSLATNLT